MRHYAASVGTPRTRVPPEDLGISTARTGGGKYVPDDIRFQILYRLSPRSFSNISMVTPSAPAAPLFALTLFHACHTSCFGMANGFPSRPDMFTRLLPGHRPGCSGKQPQMSRPLRSAPITGTSALLRAGPPTRAATVLSD